MTQYFSRITADHWTAKNRLDKAAKEVAMIMDRKIINQEDIEVFKTEFTYRIDIINKEFSRCKPLVLDIWLPEHRKGVNDISFSISGVFDLMLFEAKEAETK